jgi:hypothetical protein
MVWAAPSSTCSSAVQQQGSTVTRQCTRTSRKQGSRTADQLDSKETTDVPHSYCTLRSHKATLLCQYCLHSRVKFDANHHPHSYPAVSDWNTPNQKDKKALRPVPLSHCTTACTATPMERRHCSPTCLVDVHRQVLPAVVNEGVEQQEHRALVELSNLSHR